MTATTDPAPRASVLLEALEAALAPTHAVGLPDNASAALFERLTRHPRIRLVSVTREGEAFAVASGVWAGGGSPLVVVQNTGLLESGDALRGTAVRMGVPLVFVVTYRGRAGALERTPLPPELPLRVDALIDPRVDSVALHTEPTLEAWGIPRFGYGSDADAGQVGAAAHRARAEGRPVALLLEPDARMSGRLTKDDLLAPLARLRGDAVVVTSMSVVRPWARLSTHPLDFASADSAMGHTADFALGLALSCPDRRVICLNGDGSTLMTLGTLVTIAEAAPANLVLFVIVNGTYEITGNQPIPGASRVDFRLARAAGIPCVHAFGERTAYEQALPELLERRGPVAVVVRVEPGTEPPLERAAPGEPPYLSVSLAESTRRLREALLRR